MSRLDRLVHQPLPEPPGLLRRGPFRPGRFASPLRTERSAAWLGLWLGVAFGICFLTGLISHGIQRPPGWFWWPSRPVNLYRVTQGLHVATGLASIPLLLAKLWVVYPRLFTWPPAKDVAHAVSRAAVLVLVASAIFQVTTGLLNIARWYEPFGFFFTVAHYWTAWIAIGAIVVHIGAQLHVVRRVLRNPGEDRPLVDVPTGAAPAASAPAASAPAASAPAASAPAASAPAASPPSEATLSRRAFVATVGASVGAVTLATVGQTIAPLSSVSVLAPRRPEVGSQGLPVNKSARSAGVRELARDPGYRLVVNGPRQLVLSLSDLQAMPQRTVELPITCVEGWSAGASWTGVRMRDLLDEAGFAEDAELQVTSLQRSGLYRTSRLVQPHARDPLTLLALRLNGAELDLDHGFPCRLIAPNRPGVLQTKWVARIEARG